MRFAVPLILVASTTTACVSSSPTDAPEKPLADLHASLSLSSGADLKMTIEDPTCASLAPEVVVKLDGASGVVQRTGTWVDVPNGAFDSESVCNPPTVVWGPNQPADAPTTFELTDGATTWTMIVDRPTTKRAFDGITEGATLHGGEQVTLRMTPASGDIDVSQARVVLTGASGTRSLWGGSALAVTGSELRFTMPTTAASETLQLQVIVLVHHTILECTGPASCTSVRWYDQTQTVTLAP